MASDDYRAYIGNRYYWGNDEFFGIQGEDRRHHLYVVGKTGTGKTTLLRNLVVQDIEAGRGVGVIDAHGDLANDLLDYVPSRRTDDVVYFNPADAEYPIGLNLLRSFPRQQHLVASGIVSAFKSIWGEFWGPRLEYILYATVAALAASGHTTLLGIPRMLTDRRYRLWLLKQVSDPMVHSFWTDEFDAYETRFQREAIAPIQNKVGQLFMSPAIRNTLGQVRSKIDLRFMMDNRRLLIANLSKGRLGEDKSNLLGALLVAQFQLAAMSRADTPEAARQDFHLYVDEFQNFASDSFASILSEARKYRLCLTLSHQFVDQLREGVRDAVFGNVGSIVAFRVGHSDASVLEREFGGAYNSDRLTELPNHEVCAKILTNGEHREPFLGKTLGPMGRLHGGRENIIRRSREKYAVSRVATETKLNRWMNDGRFRRHN